ncbi:hypothetical protein H6P81_019740 [Aristolochia fimbriata]|uniref:Uncharacterized protein n=1 Tax=Aristolochia fimbriata TaxID=158543 RepID=A0AAV7DSK4_ARIFI|nr:hypothetical protein H6P81_019740 [Aristolochia fimbriata]
MQIPTGPSLMTFGFIKEEVCCAPRSPSTAEKTVEASSQSVPHVGLRRASDVGTTDRPVGGLHVQAPASRRARVKKGPARTFGRNASLGTEQSNKTVLGDRGGGQGGKSYRSGEDGEDRKSFSRPLALARSRELPFLGKSASLISLPEFPFARRLVRKRHSPLIWLKTATPNTKGGEKSADFGRFYGLMKPSV